MLCYVIAMVRVAVAPFLTNGVVDTTIIIRRLKSVNILINTNALVDLFLANGL